MLISPGTIYGVPIFFYSHIEAFRVLSGTIGRREVKRGGRVTQFLQASQLFIPHHDFLAFSRLFGFFELLVKILHDNREPLLLTL